MNLTMKEKGRKKGMEIANLQRAQGERADSPALARNRR